MILKRGSVDVRIIEVRPTSDGLIYCGLAKTILMRRYHFVARRNEGVGVFREETPLSGREHWRSVTTPRRLSVAVRNAINATS